MLVCSLLIVADKQDCQKLRLMIRGHYANPPLMIIQKLLQSEYLTLLTSYHWLHHHQTLEQAALLQLESTHRLYLVPAEQELKDVARRELPACLQQLPTDVDD